ncbi:hypothetical protein Tco_1440687 [Tanacetum coccineum]
MHDDFVATMYPQVHESLRHPDEEHVHVENLLSSTGTLSSMKNLDAYTFASSSVPPLSTPVVDLTPPKPVSPTLQEPVFTVTTKKTTTTLPPPPPQPQSITDHALASRVSALETVRANFEKRHKLQDKTVQALQAPLRERFRDLSEADMKEILRDRMDEFLEATAKSRKRRRDDQDPPLPYSDQGKKKKHDSNSSASHQPQAQMPSAWKTTDIRDVPSSSSKQKTVSQSVKSVEDVPIPDDVHFSDIKDTDAAHIPKIKPIPDWLKPVPEEERPKTPKPD